MSRCYDYGPLDTYEVIWNTGHIEYIQAHQVLAPQPDVLGAFVGIKTNTRDGWMFHGEIDGHWKLLLSAHAEDIKSVRNVTHTRDRADGPS